MEEFFFVMLICVRTFRNGFVALGAGKRLFPTKEWPCRARPNETSTGRM